MSKEPIAIVGMSCRFPKVESLQDFWRLLENGEDTIEEINRWNIDEYFNPDKGAKDKTHQRHGSMLQKIDDFDPLFFNISPAEAAEMNPSQKLMMELVWECIENSKTSYEEITGKKIGVYIGNIWSDFEHLRKHKHAEVTSHSAVGQSANIIANRISFFYGFSGPSLVVDTGCSSSLVALHLACQSLWDGTIEQSIVGGVNHTLDPDQNILLSKFGGLSAKGKCSTFDEGADGFVRGEGAGTILLKRLSDAERDGDKIYAVIKGSAINNNGFNVNLPATSIKGQLDVLEEAYRESGIKPSDIHYVETHGTGTQLGDPTETNALGQFFSKDRKKPLHVGSVKTNVGHLEGAAGMAGLIKTVLAINKRQLPKNLNFNKPNPKIDFDGLKLQVQAQQTAWPAEEEETLKAGVNSFGWGGTNGHTVIEEYKAKRNYYDNNAKKHDHKFVLPVSARSEAALKEYALKYKNYLQYSINGAISEFIDTVTATALRKPEFEFRKMFAADSKQEMIERIDSYLKNPTITSTSIEKQKVVFVFPGQGSQWIGMGKDLYETEPVFKATIDALDEAFSKYCEWSLVAQIKATADTSRLDEIDVIQPALCAMQIALARVWQSFGIEADAVTGHSMGEVAAAYISGSISIDEAAQVICTRSRLMKTVSGKGGAMAVTELTVPEAETVVQNYPGLSVAVNNSPKSTVIAGDQSLITDLLTELEAQGKFCRQVKVDVASHSAQMEPLKEELGKALESVKPVKNTIKLYSTVRNAEVSGDTLDKSYWVDNLRNGVQFAGVMEKLVNDGYNTFIEVSPHPVLTTAINECLEAFNGQGIVSGTLYRNKPEEAELYGNLDTLYQQGLKLDWNKFYKNPNVPFVSLPGYPFQRSTYALTERAANKGAKRDGHPWIGTEMKLANMNGLHFWEAELDINEFPYLEDHVVSDKIVLPGVSYIEMVHAAAVHLTGNPMITISELDFKSAVTVNEGEKVKVQLKIEIVGKSYHFNFYQLSDGEWIETATGTFENKTDLVNEIINIDIKGNAEPQKLYDQLQSIGLYYGPYFQGLEEVEITEGLNKASVTVNDGLKYSLNHYSFHPAVLDACLQTLFAAEKNNDEGKVGVTYLAGMERIEINRNLHTAEKLYVNTEIVERRVTSNGNNISLKSNCTVTNESGAVIMKFTGLKGKIFIVDQASGAENNWHYNINWAKEEISFDKPAQKSIVLVAPVQDESVQILSKQIADAGHELSLITSNTGKKIAFDKAFAQIDFNKTDRVVYFHSGNTMTTNGKVDSSNAFGLIEMFQDLEERKLTQYPGVTVVTSGAFGVSADHINLSAGPVVGVSRVAFNELSQYEPQLVDLSYNMSPLEVKSLVNILAAPVAGEREIALRNDAIYVSRLDKFSAELQHMEKATFCDEGYHLVTGYKGIAFSLVEWMFERGAKNFCLISRSNNLKDDLQARIDNLKNQGATFKIVDCDVCDEAPLTQLIHELEAESGLKSIIHAAGVINAEEIAALTEQEFSDILAPKVTGGWNLHKASRDLHLDLFLTFSSASSLLGLSGQVSYVAANTFLDTLAQYRRKQNLPAVSINWGVMSDVGMVASEKHLEKFAEAEGFIATEMQRAVDALDKIYDQCPANMGVFMMKPEQTGEHFPALGGSKYFEGLLQKDNSAGNGKSLIETLESVPNSEEWLAALESHLKELTASIIKTSADQLSTTMKFKNLGIDSLMAVQFRNKLEKELNMKLSVADIWEHPTISEYSTFLAEKLFKVHKQDNKNQVSQPSIVCSEPKAEHKMQLICFHDAGGNASLYGDWEEKLAEHIQLITVELPGRGQTSSMAPLTEMKQTIQKVTDAVMDVMNKPAIFFGHSMGGLIAFEVMKELRRRIARLPLNLIVSSTPQLASYDKQHLDHNVSDKVLMERFPHLSESAIPDQELREILINLIRNDLALLSTYEYEFAPPLDANIIAIHGKDDATVSRKQMQLWENETTLKFKFVERDGDHHYLRSCSDYVTGLINSEVASKILSKSKTDK